VGEEEHEKGKERRSAAIWENPDKRPSVAAATVTNNKRTDTPSSSSSS
jgi:hypothetical protein